MPDTKKASPIGFWAGVVLTIGVMLFLGGRAVKLPPTQGEDSETWRIALGGYELKICRKNKGKLLHIEFEMP